MEEYIKNSENDVDQREQSCQRQSACTSVLEVSITGVQAVRCLLVLAKKQFRECGKTNAYSANIEFNVSAHGEHIRERKAPTENSNRGEVREGRPVEGLKNEEPRDSSSNDLRDREQSVFEV